MDHVVFLEADVRHVFPTDNVSIQTEPLNDYAAALQDIEGGKYFRSPTPHSQADIARLIFDHWKAQKRKPKDSKYHTTKRVAALQEVWLARTIDKPRLSLVV